MDSPAENETITNSKLVVSGRIIDQDNDQSKVNVWIEDHSNIYGWDNDVLSGNFSIELNVGNLQNGTYTIIAQGYDANNNKSDPISVKINLNITTTNHAPVVTINSSVNNSTITSSTLEISGTITDQDNDQSKVKVWVDKYETTIYGEDQDVSDETFSVSLDFGSLPKGNYTIIAQGYDSQNITGQLVSVNITTVSLIISISTGTYNSLILKEDVTLWATGFNNFGQLGSGDTNNISTFTQVLAGVKQVSAGGLHTLILKEDGTLWATGYN
ncbi:MAG: Ig-like domain-containing protein [Exilispira sp.]